MSFGGAASDAPEMMNGTALFEIVLPPLTISRNALLERPGGTMKAETPSASFTTPTRFPPISSCAPAGTPALTTTRPPTAPTFGSNSRRSSPRAGMPERTRTAAAQTRRRLTPSLYAPAAGAANGP